MTAHQKFSIVGGGIAGLVCAWELSRLGHDITVYERRGLGGVVTSHELYGVELDAGAESFATRNTAVKDLLEDLGLEGKIVAPLNKPSWIYTDSGAYPSIPGVFGVPGDDQLPAQVLSAPGYEIFLHDADLGALGAEEPVSLGELVELRMGKEVVDKLVAPVVAGVHAASPYDLDANSVIPGVQKLLKTEGSLRKAVARLKKAAPAGQAALGLEGGMFRLTEELVKQTKAQGVRFINKDVKSLEDLHGTIIIATERDSAQGLLSSIVPMKEAHKGADIALVSLVVESEELNAAPRGTGVLVDEKSELVQAKALTHASAKWEWIAQELPENTHVVRLSYGRPGQPAPSDEDIVSLAVHDAQVLLGTSFDLLESDIVRWPQGIPLSKVGQAEEINKIKEKIQTEKDLEIVGAWVAGTGLASVVGQARETAQRLT